MAKRIKIYEDPFTCTRLIGEATVIGETPRFLGVADGAKHFGGNVRFDDGHEMYAQWTEKITP